MMFLRIRVIGLLAIGLAGVAVIPSATADTILYGSTGDLNANGGGQIYRIDVTTQAVSLVGNTGFDRLGGIAFDGNGTLYGVSGGSSAQSTLLTINPVNGMATVVGLLSDPNAHIDGLRFNSQGVLYGSAYQLNLGVGVLVTINSSNANILSSLTLMGSGNSFATGIAFNSANVLYASRGNSLNHAEDLDLVNQVSGQMTPVGPMEIVISDVAFSIDGTLYGSANNGNLYSIDPSTGTKTLLFNTGIANLSGLAGAVPEPSSAVLLGITIVVFSVTMRYRTRRSQSS
ncbi:MAG: PEP-CTERM sorting domain-containing protein [Verrucomicrobiota bacterium]